MNFSLCIIALERSMVFNHFPLMVSCIAHHTPYTLHRIVYTHFSFQLHMTVSRYPFSIFHKQWLCANDLFHLFAYSYIEALIQVSNTFLVGFRVCFCRMTWNPIFREHLVYDNDIAKMTKWISYENSIRNTSIDVMAGME